MTEKKDYERMKSEIADLRCAVAGLIAENERLKEGRMHLTEIIARFLIQNFELMDECIPDWRYHCTDLLYELKEALR
ncbi:hypothetical protein N2384_28720 [Bacillus paralicheniformis]|uniref:hypothetical protein n=1 Tax=Bacillus paralicheniformis TaxID=1648923 RepID=UPI0021A4DD89|nr:hypothetical protein [Bacillus paralicheniformis]UWS61824.1 hypothetical protein N2384_28720 [Bacillus paralicheniformis]